MTKNKILIFSATYNEAKNIQDFLKCIDELDLEVDVLIIDDNSPDKTWKIVQWTPICHMIPKLYQSLSMN